MSLFLQQVMNGLVIGSTYAVVAIGFALAFTVLRVIHFAHPEVFMIGMFAGMMGSNWAPGSGLLFALAAGAIGAAIVGFVIERLVISPLRGRDMLMTLVATIGVSIILQNGMAIIVGPDPVPYPNLIPAHTVELGAVSLTLRQLANFGVCITLVALVSLYVRFTSIGRATRAIAEQPAVSAAFGINVARVCQITILVASIMAGVAAVSVGALYGSTSAFVGLFYGLKAFIAMLVAGNRYFEGAALVAIALGVIEALVTGYVSSGMRDVVAFMLLIGVLYLRPNGIFGSFNSH